ncbi:MAG: M56 family metallopeptidase [Planctomycetota bacterium]
MKAFFEGLFAATESVIAAHGLSLLAGTTIVLAFGLLLMRIARSDVDRHRTAVLTLLATGFYLAFAVLPLPRWLATGANAATTSTAASNTPIDRVLPVGVSKQPPASPLQSAESQQLLESASAGGSEAMAPHTGTAPGTAVEPAGELAPERLPDGAAPLRDLAALPSPGLAEASPGLAEASPELAGAAQGWRLPLSTLLAFALLAGAAWFSLLLGLGLLRLRRVVANGRDAPAELRRIGGLPRHVRLRIVESTQTPFCYGLLRPAIAVPRHLAEPSQTTRYVLRHELAHIDHGDTRARLLFALLRSVLFWHPLFWQLGARMRFCGERIADDTAANVPNGSTADYVRCMLALSTGTEGARAPALAAPIFHRKSELYRRFQTMLQSSQESSRSWSARTRIGRTAGTALLTLAAAATFGVAPTQAQEPARPSSPPPANGATTRTIIRELRAELQQLNEELSALQAERARGGGGDADGSQGAGQAPPAPEPTIEYVVEAGDTFAKIAKRVFGSTRAVDRLIVSNPEVDPRKLRVGQKLRIPSPHKLQAPGKPDAPVAPPKPRDFAGEADILSVGSAVFTPPPPQPPAAPNAQPPAPHSLPNLRTTLPDLTDLPAKTESAFFPSQAREAHTPASRLNPNAASAGLGELANLVERCFALSGEMREQQVYLAHAKSTVERQVAEIRLETKQKSYRALRDVLKFELDSSLKQLDRTKKLYSKGFVPESDLLRIQRRVRLLRSAL